MTLVKDDHFPPGKNSKDYLVRAKRKLHKLVDFVSSQQVDGIAYRFVDYLELVDWTGRAVRDDKTDYIPENEPKILEKLGIDSAILFKTVVQYSDSFYSHIGSESQLQAICQDSDQKWLVGMRSCRQLF